MALENGMERQGRGRNRLVSSVIVLPGIVVGSSMWLPLALNHYTGLPTQPLSCRQPPEGWTWKALDKYSYQSTSLYLTNPPRKMNKNCREWRMTGRKNSSDFISFKASIIMGIGLDQNELIFKDHKSLSSWLGQATLVVSLNRKLRVAVPSWLSCSCCTFLP